MTDLPAVVYLKAESAASNEASINTLDSDELKTRDLNMKQSKKKFKASKTVDSTKKKYESLKKLLKEFDKDVKEKLDTIGQKLDMLNENCDSLEGKIDSVSLEFEKQNTTHESKAVCNGCFEDNTGPAIHISSKVTFITLNSEEDYPNGSWLGDERNPELRVRCHILPTDLFHINTTCTTAEKMALTVLDYLFDRETQASSNISGLGKHKKKQLDPLYIYGIKCHLIYHFGITDHDWEKIKQNIDSKCRTAFRRKMKGLPLVTKTHQAITALQKQDVNTNISDFRSTSRDSDTSNNPSSDPHYCDDDKLSFQIVESVADENLLARVMQESKIVHSEQGSFQVLQATAEQVAKIQQSHQIHLIDGDKILTSIKLSPGSNIPLTQTLSSQENT